MINISFETPEVFASFASIPVHHALTDLLIWFDSKFGKIILTSAYRSAKIHAKDSGIHSTIPLRAVDLRSKDYCNPLAIATEINAHWEYDPARPGKVVCVYHNVGLGYHFHLQVHGNTYRR